MAVSHIRHIRVRLATRLAILVKPGRQTAILNPAHLLPESGLHNQP
uniref:Uncharacterized protein n=1 Tax=Arundo donax TaxID=35708 RepID=A0A0A8ZWK6_ARUDO